ncbi:uncharacterized protein LOC122895631 [Neovison vison]|uniref:uncharacterized protein LOC122895631 n=1 Tax=Neovison vison TaxID=452646 RepID=UPI001CEFBA2F|nr:uncharacterized protein LOC122895631 [Neogale vison]
MPRCQAFEMGCWGTPTCPCAGQSWLWPSVLLSRRGWSAPLWGRTSVTVQEGPEEALGPAGRFQDPGGERGARLAGQPGAEPDRECLARKGGQRATSSACPTPLTRVPVTRPRSLSWGPRGSPESQVAGALGDAQTEPSLDQVLQERDEAIAKKQALEAELDTCKAKLRAVEAQLLEVLEEKLRLRQEVEAWEEDMQQLVRQRVESQLRRESRGTLGTPLGPRTARVPWVRFPLGRWGRWR